MASDKDKEIETLKYRINHLEQESRLAYDQYNQLAKDYSEIKELVRKIHVNSAKFITYESDDEDLD